MTAERITTAAELDALPVGSVVRDVYGEVREKFQMLPTASEPVWFSPFIRAKRDSRAIAKRGPVAVLYRPDRDLIAEAEARGAREALLNAAQFWAENPDDVDDETPADVRNWLRARAEQAGGDRG